MMARKRYKPVRRLKPKRAFWKKVLKNRFFWFGLLGLFVLGGAIYGIFFTPFLQIQHIEVEGAQKVSVEKLQELVREYIPKKFVFFAINNLFLADVSKVAQEVRAAFPEVEAVSVDTTFPNKVKVSIQERGAVAVWCQEKSYTVEAADPSATQEELATRVFRECFALDSNGIIFEQKEPDREVVIQNGGSNAALGERVIEPETLARIFTFQQNMDSSSLFQEAGLRVSELSVVSEERVNAQISEGWELYFNPLENVDWQSTKAELVLKEEVPQEKRAMLEYIDLRFGDQAYIKYRSI